MFAQQQFEYVIKLLKAACGGRVKQCHRERLLSDFVFVFVKGAIRLQMEDSDCLCRGGVCSSTKLQEEASQL